MKKVDTYFIFSGILIIIICLTLAIQLSPPKIGYDRVITRIYYTENERYALEVAETFNYSKLLNIDHTYSPPFTILDNITINMFNESALQISNSNYVFLNYTALSIEEQNITLSLNNTSTSQYSSKRLVISCNSSKILVNNSYITLATTSSIYSNFDWKFYEFNSSLNNFTFIDHEFSYMLNNSNYFVEMHLQVDVYSSYNNLYKFIIINKMFQPIFIIIASSNYSSA